MTLRDPVVMLGGMKAIRLISLVLAAIGLAGCGGSGTRLVKPEQAVLSIPEIDGSFAPIPLKVAVYITPQTMGALHYFDARSRGELLSYGTIGPGVLDGVMAHFPRAFAEVSVIGDFPDPGLIGEDIDAVVVFESGTGSGWWEGQLGTSFADTLLNIGLYAPGGERVSGYQVIGTTRFDVPTDMNIERAVRNQYPQTGISARNTVRLALHRFPRDQVAALKAAAASKADPASVSARRSAFRASVAAAVPKSPGEPIEAMAWAKQTAQRAQVLSAMSLAVNVQMATLPGANPKLIALSNRMNRQILEKVANTNAPAGAAGTSWLEFLGGLAPDTPITKIAMDVAMGASLPEATGRAVCAELQRRSEICSSAGSRGRCLIYGVAHSAKCAPS
jgi:hypothetical protein